MFGSLYLLVAACGGDDRKRTPVVPVSVDGEVFPVLGGNKARKLPEPVGLELLLLKLAVDELRHKTHVLYHLLRLLEDISREAL